MPGEPHEIRAYTERDRETVTEIVRDALAEHGFTLATGGLAEDLAQAHASYAAGGAGFWVAVRGDEILGTVAVRPRGAPVEQTCELKRLYLRKEARGAGLGQALYAHAEAFARAAGYAVLWLDSSRRFVQARRLYERNGFVLLAELDNAWEDNVYAKRLSG